MNKINNTEYTYKDYKIVRINDIYYIKSIVGMFTSVQDCYMTIDLLIACESIKAFNTMYYI